jgi:hypothetical protein
MVEGYGVAFVRRENEAVFDEEEVVGVCAVGYVDFFAGGVVAVGGYGVAFCVTLGVASCVVGRALVEWG